MRRQSILLLVLSLVVASMLATLAYTAEKLNHGEYIINVVNTSTSLLDLEAGPQEKGAIIINNLQRPTLDLYKSQIKYFNIKWNDDYKWDNLFKVKNNTDKMLKVIIWHSNLDEVFYFALAETGETFVECQRGSDWGNKTELILEPKGFKGDAVWINARMKTPPWKQELLNQRLNPQVYVKAVLE